MTSKVKAAFRAFTQPSPRKRHKKSGQNVASRHEGIAYSKVFPLEKHSVYPQETQCFRFGNTFGSLAKQLEIS